MSGREEYLQLDCSQAPGTWKQAFVFEPHTAVLKLLVRFQSERGLALVCCLGQKIYTNNMALLLDEYLPVCLWNFKF